LSNGDKIIFNWNNIFVRNENNEIIGVTSIGEDVTQNKKDELINEVYNNINKLSINVNNITDFYKKAHKELQRLFDIKNFYISIHDKENDEVAFPYFADETRPAYFIFEPTSI